MTLFSNKPTLKVVAILLVLSAVLGLSLFAILHKPITDLINNKININKTINHLVVPEPQPGTSSTTVSSPLTSIKTALRKHWALSITFSVILLIAIVLAIVLPLVLQHMQQVPTVEDPEAATEPLHTDPSTTGDKQGDASELAPVESEGWTLKKTLGVSLLAVAAITVIVLLFEASHRFKGKSAAKKGKKDEKIIFMTRKPWQKDMDDSNFYQRPVGDDFVCY